MVQPGSSCCFSISFKMCVLSSSYYLVSEVLHSHDGDCFDKSAVSGDNVSILFHSDFV